MKILMKTLVDNKLKLFLLLLAVFFLFVGIRCTNSLDSPTSDNPVGSGIILVNIDPSTTFGNGSTDSLSQVQVITQTFPDGSPIQFKLNSNSQVLPSLLRGCLLNADTALHDGGQAFAEYLPGIFIGPGGSGTPPPPATVNIAVTISRPNTQDTETDFGTVTLNAVNIIGPQDSELEVPQASDSGTVGATLKFLTVGIPPATIVNFALSNPALGSLNPTSTTVLGSEQSGSATTSYLAVNGQAGTQIITATLVLPNLFDPVNRPNCPDVPVAERRIQAVVVITQSVAAPTPAPSTPAPSPGP